MINSTLQFIVIDDDKLNNSVCSAAIKSATDGMVPVCFTSPAEALHYMEHEYLAQMENTPTILFLDLNMPEMNGWDWLFKFEQLPHTLKKQVTVYILSASISFKDAEKAINNVYVKACLLKPLTKAKVIEVIEAHKMTLKTLYRTV